MQLLLPRLLNDHIVVELTLSGPGLNNDMRFFLTAADSAQPSHDVHDFYSLTTIFDPYRNITILALVIYHTLLINRLMPQQIELAYIPLVGAYVAACQMFEVVDGLNSLYVQLIAAVYLLIMISLTLFAPLGPHSRLALGMYCVYAVAYFGYMSHFHEP